MLSFYQNHEKASNRSCLQNRVKNMFKLCHKLHEHLTKLILILIKILEKQSKVQLIYCNDDFDTTNFEVC